ncbi:MAG TPA: matrixin family metalloprotease [Lacunisphaera sp.]
MKNKAPLLALSVLAGLFAAVAAWSFTYIVDQRESGTALPLKWPPGSVAIQIKLGSTANLSDGNSYNTSAQAAAQMWNTHLGNLQITMSLLPAGPADENNNLNELVFASDVFGDAFDTNTVAITTVWSRGNERTRADIVYNSARTWDSYDGPTRSGVIDLQRVTLHELGHLLGLDHPDEAGQSVQAIMNSRISSLDALASDDITGAQNIYGPPGQPANDSFANAAIIILPASNTATLSGYNTNATKQAGEPSHAGNVGGRSVWWRWTAPAAGPVTVDTRGSYFDTTLGVYTGTAVNSLVTLAGNDDLSSSPQPHIQASSVTFTAVAGTTYYIAVDGFDADCAGLTLNVSFTPTGPLLPVITTQPVSATVASGGSASFSVTATGATGYQWTFNGNNLSGATGATHTISNATAANAGSYRVVVSNGTGSVTSDPATLTVNAPAAPPAPPPSSGGGGGGGAPSLWFCGALGLLGLARLLLRRR